MSLRLLASGTFVATVLMCGSAYAQNDPDQPKVDCNNAQTQMDMNICSQRDYDKADKALNEQYKKTRAAMVAIDSDLDADLKGAEKALVKAQRAWVDYRDGECEAEGSPGEGRVDGADARFRMQGDIDRAKNQRVEDVGRWARRCEVSAKRRIMIVGNGEIAEGAATEIDAADLVVRFNDCRSIETGGSRTDVVAVCNTGRPARAMLGSAEWRNSSAGCCRIGNLECARSPQVRRPTRSAVAIASGTQRFLRRLHRSIHRFLQCHRQAPCGHRSVRS